MSTTTASNKATTNGYKYSLDGDSLSQDLHFKMSKKIAQLTKVIYVLNTRNDDHDVVIESLVKQHKEELRHAVAEVEEKVEELESRLKTRHGDQLRIRELQDSLQSYEGVLEETKTQFLSYKQEVIKHNAERDAEHIKHLSLLNDKLSSLGSSYKDLWDNCDESQRKMEIEKTKLIKSVEERYEKEILELKEQFSKKEEQLRDLISGNEKEIEIELLKTQEEVKTAATLKEKIIFQYENQIKELKNSFKEHLSESVDETKKLLEFELEEANAKIQEFQNRTADKENSMHSLIEKHLKELREKDLLIEESEKETELIKVHIQEKTLIISKYVKEVESLKEMIKKLEVDLKNKQGDIEKLKKLEDSLNGQLQIKTKQIKDLKNSLEASEQKIKNKDYELKEAIQTIESMNQENNQLEHCTKSVSVDYEIQIQTLKRGLENLNTERQLEKQALERLQLNHDIEIAELQNRLKNEHSSEMDKFTKKLEKEFSGKEKLFKEELQKLKEENQMRIEDERSKASKMIEKIKNEIDQLKIDSNSKLKAKEKQLSAQETVAAEKEKELKGVILQNKTLKESVSNLKKDNHRLTSTVEEKEVLVVKLTKDIEKLKQSWDEEIMEKEKLQKTIKIKVQEDMSEKYNQLSADLDKKWADTLRRETGRLRNDMLESFAKEKEKITEKYEQTKNEEISSIRNEMNEANSCLRDEILVYKNILSKLESELLRETENVNKQSNEKIHQLENKLTEEKAFYLYEISKMQDIHCKEVEQSKSQFMKDKSEYMSEMEELLETTDREWRKKLEFSIKHLNEENEKAMKEKLDEIVNKHNREVSNQVNNMQQRMSLVQQDSVENYKSKIKSLHEKVNFLEGQSKLHLENYRVEIEKSKAAKAVSDLNCEKLDNNLKEILKENDYLKKQLEELSDDYHQNQKEFTEKMRKNENDLKLHFEQITNNNRLQLEEDSKKTLQDFNKAQNLFKDKIKELSGKLFEVEELYQTRPSRDEDIELIETLKAQLRTSEKEVERMNEEKKFFQLELMNRETNFNKIFNTSPNVSKFDSTQSAIKTKKTNSEKLKNLHKLTPLPGSPFHDDPINPARPLPPSRKSIDAS